MPMTTTSDQRGKPPHRRKLVAVTYWDMVGYSRLIGLDDAGTLQRLRALRRDLIDPAIEEHGGKIVQTSGDSLLIVFDSIDGAVRCALKVQEQVPIHDGDQPADRAIRFRVGINIGDAIADGTDLHGDAVNVAARLQAECPPGSICVTRPVRDHVQDRLDLAFEPLGALNLKNIARSVEAFVLRPNTTTTPKSVEGALVYGTGEALPLPDKPSIAVLPFTNMSDDRDQEYFSDGIAEDIITELSRSRSLFVIARNSSFTYRGRSVDVRQVARGLGVRYVLEGSVRRSGSRVRVTAQLIDAETGNHIWAERYDRGLEDVFAVQDQITTAVVIAILPAVADAELHRALRRPPDSLGAWEACQRGLWHMAKHTPADTKRAQHFFMRACELDALLATPHALLAACYIQMRGFGALARQDQDTAEVEVRKAIALDPEDSSALATLSAISLYNYADYEAALEHAEHAISVNPNDFGAHLGRGRALAFGGRPAEAEEPLLIALRLSPRDPLKSSALNTLAIARYFRGDYAEAAKLEQRAIRDYPGYPIPHRWLAASLGQLNRIDEAREALRQAIAISQASFDSFVRQRQPFFLPEDHEHMLEGLRKAGWQG
jgi:adenylate cyclase